MDNVSPIATEMKRQALIGKRVDLYSLYYGGPFPGVIIEHPFWGMTRETRDRRPIVAVQLDRQPEPLGEVLYYEAEPEVVESNLWQYCIPEEDGDGTE